MTVPKVIYVRLFAVLFLLEVLVEWVGYQVLGRWLYGGRWEYATTWEPGVHLLWMLVISTPILYFWMVSQMKRQRLYVNQLRDKENEFLSLFYHNADALLTFNANGQLMDMNPAAQRTLGWTLKDMQRMGPQMFATATGQAGSQTYFQQALQGETKAFDNELMRKDGRIISVLETLVPIYHGEEVSGVYLIAKDVTEQREANQRIWQLAHHDHLTKLPNRRLFFDQLELALAKAESDGHKFAVLFMDLDRFKYINDALGHDVGDEVLKRVADRLAGCVRGGTTLVRLGGDEFAVLLPHIEHVNEAKNLAETILHAVPECISFDGHEFFLTMSIGIALYPVSAESAAALVRNADMAMYEAKRSGKNRYHIHMSSMHEYAYERFRLENDLRKALKLGEDLLVEYQPQVDVVTGHIVSSEALIRWNHPVIGRIPPGEYIPLAEATGLIDSLGDFVLRQVCRQIQEWTSEGREPVPVAVNVSPVELGRPDFVQRFCTVVESMGIPPHLIGIEITESTLMKNERTTLLTLKALKAFGIRISIDDFGRGYSSLGFLKQFPVDVLKVDEIFVRELDSNLEDVSIVTAVIALAHSRHLQVIAEGVERAQQLLVLQQSDCDTYQGYLFCPPVSAEIFAQRYL